jgi:hypothetical protein
MMDIYDLFWGITGLKYINPPFISRLGKGKFTLVKNPKLRDIRDNELIQLEKQMKRFANERWTTSQQQALEGALLSVEKDFEEWTEQSILSYWNAVSKRVAGKGAAQCLCQYQTLRQKLRVMANHSTTNSTTPNTVLKPSQILQKKKKPMKPMKPTEPTKPTNATPKPTPRQKVPKHTTRDTKVVSAPADQSTLPTPSTAVPLLPIKTPPAPWTPEEHAHLEQALKEFQGVQDKREKWRLIASKIPTRKASQCLLKYKQMRKALIQEKQGV